MSEALPIPLPPEDEKEEFQATSSIGLSPEESPSFDAELERRVVRKCDLRVVPPTMLMFMLSFLDRVNIGNARIQGMEKDLNMGGSDYNVALLILFVPFIIFEVPANLIMKKVKPSTWLSSLLFLCGIINVSMGFVRSYEALVGVRFLLGVFEAGTGPGSIYLISMYYRRYELPFRICWWYNASIISGAFGGLLAYAIAHMDGVQGYSGWRWIFIIEGAITATVAIGMKWLIVDWPEDATFLTKEEKECLLWRLTKDRAEEAQMNRWNTRRVFSDWKIYLGMLMFFGIVTMNYGFSFFTPTILVEMGYRAITAQVLTIPIYVVASIFCLTFGYLSDRLKHRYGFIMSGLLLGYVAYIILLAQEGLPVGVKYFALFLAAGCGYTAQPLLVGWILNNVGGHYKRAFASAVQIGWGNAGGILASNIFITREAPYFKTGFGVSLGGLVLTGTVATLLLVLLRLENKKRQDGKRDHRLHAQDADNLGDDDPRFRFAY